MATNSITPGFLLPAGSIPTDKDLEDVLNPTIAGITGLNADRYVRPRFQEDPPPVPDRTVNWVAFGVNRLASETQAAVTQIDDSTATVMRYQELEILLSWYGPQASNYAEMFRDGLQIGQNRYLLEQADIGIVDIGEAKKAPELFKEKFLTRYDMFWMIRRRTQRIYPVVTLLGFNIQLTTDPLGSTPININYTP